MDGYIIDWSAVAAFLAAGAALYGVWRGKITAQNNLSAELDLERVRFREKWIQNLREEMANIAAFSETIETDHCLLYTSPSPRDATLSRMPSSA